MTTPTVQPVYATTGTITNAVASLATSSTLVAGWESAVFDNTTSLYDDVLLSGQIMVGTTPTVGLINVYCVAALDPSAPTWPDVFDGTASVETVSSLGVASGYMRLVASLSVDSTTSNRAYPFAPVSVASLFGGVLPQKFVLFTTHNTVAALNSTSANHFIITQGVNYAMPSV